MARRGCTVLSLPLDAVDYGSGEGGRASETYALLTLLRSPSLVRSPILRLSNCEKVAMTHAIASPVGVDVSTFTSKATRAQPCRRDVSKSSVKSLIDLTSGPIC